MRQEEAEAVSVLIGGMGRGGVRRPTRRPTATIRVSAIGNRRTGELREQSIDIDVDGVDDPDDLGVQFQKSAQSWVSVAIELGKWAWGELQGGDGDGDGGGNGDGDGDGNGDGGDGDVEVNVNINIDIDIL